MLKEFKKLYYQLMKLLKAVYLIVLFFTSLKTLLPVIFIGQKKIEILFFSQLQIALDMGFQEH